MPPLRYIHSYRDRHDHQRHYFRRRGSKKIALPGDPGSIEFMTAYYAALAAEPAKKPIGANRNPKDSIAHWVALYLESAAFVGLAPTTRSTRRNMLERFRKANGVKNASTLSQELLEKMVSELTPVVARNFLKALRPWMAWCVKQGLRKDNPAIAVERPAYKSPGYKTWPAPYIETFRKRHPLGGRPRLALELLVNTGLARADVIRLGKQHLRDGMLIMRRQKTGVLIEIPVLPDLQAVLDQYPGDNLTFLLTEHGKPFSEAGFGNWFRECCDAAGIPKGYSAHGIRKYAATLRANLGATAHQLMAWFGWLTIREAERYTREAERRRLAISLGDMVNAENVRHNNASEKKGSRS